MSLELGARRQSHAGARDRAHRLAEAQLDATRLEGLACVPLDLRVERREHRGPGLDEDRSGPAGIDFREVVTQHPHEELCQRAGHLDTGWPRAGDHEGEHSVVDQ